MPSVLLGTPLFLKGPACMDGHLAPRIVWARTPGGSRRSQSKPSRESPPNGSPLNGVRGSALVITNLIKLGGLAVALNEALVRTADLRPGVLAIAAFMMAGGQGLETLLDKVLGK